MKIAIIGAGNVGATLAMRIVEKDLGDVVMVDVRGDIAKAKSMDLSDAASIIPHESQISGTDDFKEIKDSSVVIITAGFPRKPGMKREELLSENKGIIEKISVNIKKYASNSIVIVVTNPLDIMTYIVYKNCNFPKKRIFGMAGDLDASRFTGLISKRLNTKRSFISTIVIGSHGETMVPVISHTKISGKPINQLFSKEDIEKLVKDAKERGAKVVSLLGEGSAYYAPSAAILGLVESILMDKRDIHCVSAFLEGEYGVRDICIGVPVKIGKEGIEEILEIELSPEEKRAFEYSAEVIKDNLKFIK